MLTLFIHVESGCNLSCKNCHIWMKRKGLDQTSLNHMHRLIFSFAAYAKTTCNGGYVVLSGGEPLLSMGRLLDTIRLCTKYKLPSLFPTNGTLVTADVVHKLRDSGLDILFVSIDSSRPEYHDYRRGVPGTHAKASNAVRILAHENTKIRSTRPFVNMTVDKNNIDDIVATATYVKALGADGFGFQLLSPTFALRGSEDIYYKNNWFFEPNAIHEAKRKIRDAFEQLKSLDAGFLNTTDNDIVYMHSYLDGVKSTTMQVCDSAYSNIMVTNKGDVTLCYNYLDYIDRRPLGSIKSINFDLAKLMASERTVAVQAKMRNCREVCGMLNCHRKQEHTNSIYKEESNVNLHSS